MNDAPEPSAFLGYTDPFIPDPEPQLLAPLAPLEPAQLLPSVPSTQTTQSTPLGRRKRRTDGQMSEERMRVAKRLQNYQYTDTLAWKFVKEAFFSRNTGHNLLALARSISRDTGIRLDRDATRRKKVLLKWFNENLPAIIRYLGLRWM